jgi:hypothetical protein
MSHAVGGVDATGDASQEAGVKEAEELAAQGGRAAAVTGDEDVGALLGNSEAGHEVLLKFFYLLRKAMKTKEADGDAAINSASQRT